MPQGSHPFVWPPQPHRRPLVYVVTLALLAALLLAIGSVALAVRATAGDGGSWCWARDLGSSKTCTYDAMQCREIMKLRGGVCAPASDLRFWRAPRA